MFKQEKNTYSRHICEWFIDYQNKNDDKKKKTQSNKPFFLSPLAPGMEGEFLTQLTCHSLLHCSTTRRMNTNST